jgi:hypothetical protein
MLNILGRIMKISEKSLRFISIEQVDAINCVERTVEKLRNVKQDRALLKLLNDYFLNGNSKRYNDVTGIFIKN